MNTINIKDAYYHGLVGEEISFIMYPESALHLTLSKLENIFKYKGILSREKQKIFRIIIWNLVFIRILLILTLLTIMYQYVKN